MKRRFSQVVVLKGGISSEREVSLRSGEAVAQGLRDGGYTVTEVDVVSRELSLPSGTEAVFIALHGAFGEDGGVQQLLAGRGIPYTGSGADSCRISFDKILTRMQLETDGIPIPRGESLRSPQERTLPAPLVVKPSREGSSVGCHIVRDDAEWEHAYADAARFSGDVLVEEYIPGRELTVGVVEKPADGQPDNADSGALRQRFQVLPVVEIRPAHEWYDYEAKYMTGDTEYIVPAELDAVMTETLQEIALRTFCCLHAEGFGRVDFRLSPDGRPYVLELNAIPGFTATSLLPKAAGAAGIGFSELCCRIMENASIHNGCIRSTAAGRARGLFKPLPS